MDSEYTVSKHGDSIIVKIHKDIELSSVPAFKKTLGDNIDSGVVKVIIDLEDISYLSSAGIGAFIAGQKQINAKGGDFVLINLPESLRHVFSLAHLDVFFTIC